MIKLETKDLHVTSSIEQAVDSGGKKRLLLQNSLYPKTMIVGNLNCI